MTSQQGDWRIQLEQAIATADDPNIAKYCQLASYCQKRGAQVRTVVFRGFADVPAPQTALLIATDSRSDKLNQLREDRRVELCWYFTKPRLQFRLGGETTLCGPDNPDVNHHRVAVWKKMSDRARQSFFDITLAEKPSQASSVIDADIQRNYLDDHQNTAEPPTAFFVLLVSIEEVRVLDISNEPHTLVKHALKNDGWTERMTDA